MNKAFKDYYDAIEVDEELFEKEISHKKRYYQYGIIALSFIMIFVSLQLFEKSAYQFGIMAFQDESYCPISKSKQTLDYYLFHQDITQSDDVNVKQIESDFIHRYVKGNPPFIDSYLTYNDDQSILYGYVTTSYFTIHLQDENVSKIRIHNTTEDRIKIINGQKTYFDDITLSYKDYQKYQQSNNSLKVIWIPDSLAKYQNGDGDYSSITDNLIFEVIYKDKTSDIFTIDIHFNEKGQMTVSKRKGKIKNIQKAKDELETYSQLKNHELYLAIKDILPQAIIDELSIHGYIYQSNQFVQIKNDKDNPTLRLDFEFDDHHKLMSYVSKEYGFVGDMQVSVVKDPVSLIHTFQTIFFDCQQDLQQTTLPSRYEGGDYIAYRDQDYVYVVQQEKSMIVRCMKLEENE